MSKSSSVSNCYAWAVIGAGPAGIASVGKLLDKGVAPHSVLWIDPHFTVGDFGTLWRTVSSNTTVDLFTRFNKACESFRYTTARANKYQLQELHDVDPKVTCKLEVAADPLRDITQELMSKVHSYKGTVERLNNHEQAWRIQLGGNSSESSAIADNVILAIGAVPTRTHVDGLDMDRAREISVLTALNADLLAEALGEDETVALFGSSHTAVIIMRTLTELASQKRFRGLNIINYYQHPLRYALYMSDMILFDDTGLKGDAAKWARDHLHGKLPAGLTRVLSTPQTLKDTLPLCTKVIYATGFTRRTLSIEGLPSNFTYNPHCGVIAPGLFGCGIAFPQKNIDVYRNEEFKVGLWKFMVYLETILPLWMQYSVKRGIGQPNDSSAQV